MTTHVGLMFKALSVCLETLNKNLVAAIQISWSVSQNNMQRACFMKLIVCPVISLNVVLWLKIFCSLNNRLCQFIINLFTIPQKVNSWFINLVPTDILKRLTLDETRILVAVNFSIKNIYQSCDLYHDLRGSNVFAYWRLCDIGHVLQWC